MTGMAVFTGGFLVAIGYGAIVLSMLAAALIVIVAVALAAAWPQLQPAFGARLRRSRRRMLTIVSRLPPLCRQTWSRAEPNLRRLRESGVGTAATASRRAVAFNRRAVGTVRHLWRQTRFHAKPRVRGAYRWSVHTGTSANRWAAQTAQRATVWISSRARHTDPRRHALRLNAVGTRYRRDGLYDHAVACHRQALEIFRALDDRKAVALTQSNLALALSHAGDDNWAIGLFEEAAATLHELGDEEHEAQVIVNLGLAHRRHGRQEEGDDVLEVALSKLPPASSEYQAIEAELRRAS